MDVTIPIDAAASIAFELRHLAAHPDQAVASAQDLRRWANMLQPSSLREAVATVLMDDGWTCDFHEPDDDCGECRKAHLHTADAILQVIANRISDLRVEQPNVYRANVLQLLGQR